MGSVSYLADPLGSARPDILSAARRGDTGKALHLIVELMAEGVTFETILFDVIAPLQVEMGRRWQDGACSVSEEHAATSSFETLVALLAGSLESLPGAMRLVVACAEGDVHALPARLASTLLRYEGYEVTFLGASVPADDLAEYLVNVRPDALVLACAMGTNLLGARRCIGAAHWARVPVLVGGRGFGKDEARARRLGADGWAQHPRDVGGILESWHPEPTQAEQGVRSDGEIAHLEEERPHLIAATLRQAAPGLSLAVTGSARIRLRSDVGLFVDALLGAMVSEDSSVLGELAAWHAGVATVASSGGTDMTTMLLRSLDAAVGDLSDDAGLHLASALQTLEAS